MSEDESLPILTRLWFAFLCLFRVVFDSHFAARVWAVREPPRLASPVAPTLAPAAPPRPKEMTPALQLLSLLQREGRLVDFVQQDIASFPDADVGAAARVVHEGCRKALRAHAAIEPVRGENEGSTIVLEAGFRADEVKLTGAVGGRAPYSGVLRHRGWRALRLELPGAVGDYDASILAPAEVELS